MARMRSAPQGTTLALKITFNAGHVTEALLVLRMERQRLRPLSRQSTRQSCAFVMFLGRTGR
jgi:hypothetical protein